MVRLPGLRALLILLFSCAFAMVHLPAKLFFTVSQPLIAQATITTYVVNSALDPLPTDGICDPLGSGNGCTLRDAILLANAAPATDTIQIRFAVPQGAPGYLLELGPGGVQVESWTIETIMPLPWLEHDNITIDGFSQAEWLGFDPNSFGPEIIIDGRIGISYPGLMVQASNILIQGLAIINFEGDDGSGIEIRSGINNPATNNTIQGCYIGVNHLGNAPAPNSDTGIRVGTDNNQIGGDSALGEGNLIAGNNETGILIQSSGNRVQGNFIGLNPANTVELGNLGIGMVINGNNNSIGTTLANPSTTYRNIISGNGRIGVYIIYGNNNQVYGNAIGVDATGTRAVPNLLAGMIIQSSGGITAANNQIGNVAPQTRNIISGNGVTGIDLEGPGTSNNQIRNNLIGPSATGGVLTGVYTQTIGVAIATGASANTIGGPNAAEGNLIASNLGDGVLITGDQTANNLITRNTITANTLNGVYVTDALSTTIELNQIGTITIGPTASQQGNQQNGILVDTGSVSTTITANQIGHNLLHGIAVRQGSQAVKILDNRISRNGGKGIDLDLDPDNFYPTGSPGESNHDIDPPFNLRLNQAGLLTGQVRNDPSTNATSASSCFGCTIQVFRADPEVIDQQGRDKLLDIAVDASGYFTATLASLPNEKQLVLTATDNLGNTSEYASFNPTMGLAFMQPGYSQNANPGETISYTHHLTNTGSVDLVVELAPQLSPGSAAAWTATASPAGAIVLPAHEAATVTLTLTLPGYSDPSVIAGVLEQTRLTASSTRYISVTDTLTNTTTPLGAFILAANPPLINTNATLGSVVNHTHTLTNTGNLTGTLALTATTDLGWETLITPSQITLAPGESVDAIAQITVPRNESANTVGTTTITITASEPSQSRVLTDTTAVQIGVFLPLVTR